MGKNTSIALGDHFEEFVKNRIEEGRYNNASEIIRAGLRLLEEEEEEEEEEEQKYYALKNAIQEGIESGIAVNFNPEEHLKQLKQSKKQSV